MNSVQASTWKWTSSHQWARSIHAYMQPALVALHRCLASADNRAAKFQTSQPQRREKSTILRWRRIEEQAKVEIRSTRSQDCDSVRFTQWSTRGSLQIPGVRGRALWPRRLRLKTVCVAPSIQVRTPVYDSFRLITARHDRIDGKEEFQHRMSTSTHPEAVSYPDEIGYRARCSRRRLGETRLVSGRATTYSGKRR